MNIAFNQTLPKADPAGLRPQIRITTQKSDGSYVPDEAFVRSLNGCSLSKSLRRKYIATSMIIPTGTVLRDQGYQFSRNMNRCWQRIEKQAEGLLKLIPAYDGRSFRLMVEAINYAWARQKAENLTGVEMLHAALWLSEHTRMYVKPRSREADLWDRLCGSLNTMLTHLDPEIDNPNSRSQRIGAEVGQSIFNIS